MKIYQKPENQIRDNELQVYDFFLLIERVIKPILQGLIMAVLFITFDKKVSLTQQFLRNSCLDNYIY